MAKSKTDKKVPSFLSKLDKTASGMKGVSNSASYPEFFFDTGSCVINKIISDRYDGGYAQGRMAMLAGPSNSGKSFLAGNAIKQALNAGYGALVIDSENALDEVYLSKIGVDIDNPLFNYKGLNSLDDATALISSFFKEYNSAPDDEKIPYLIVIDSVDELKISTKAEKWEKGVIHNDMGQNAKLLKEFQSNIMHSVKHLPIGVICTKQPYDNQDAYTNKRDPHVITSSLRFAYSQILLVTNKLIRDTKTNKFDGINLSVFANKTRFAKPFQQCVIEVPYESGIDWYSGVLEAAEAMGVVSRSGAWYTFGDQKFQKKTFETVRNDVFEALKLQSGVLEYDELTEDESGED